MIRRWSIVLGTLFLVALAAGCGGEPPATETSVLPTPAAPISVLPTPPVAAGTNRILIHFVPVEPAMGGSLATIDAGGGNRQELRTVAPATSAVAASPGGEYVAFFTADFATRGQLVVWNVENQETVFQMPVPAEVTTSFRDAPAKHYLAWSPDGRRLAIVMDRDLYLLEIDPPELQLLVEHREAQYNLAGLVMGSIARPTWAMDGTYIVYDIFNPPDVLSANADTLRDVEYVNVEEGTSTIALSNAYIAQWSSRPGQSLLLQRTPEGWASLDVSTLQVQEYPSRPEAPDLSVCDAQGETCVSILSVGGEQDVLRIEQLPQGPAQDVTLAEVGATADCQFQSLLLSPGGERVLATLGCAGQVSLWSVDVVGGSPSQLVDWTGAQFVILLSWIE